MIARMLAALLLVAACAGPQTTNTQSSPVTTPGPTEPAPGTTPPLEGPKLGEPCGAGDVCGEGSCVSYHGIAGARGGELKSCEIRCDPSRSCEGGRQCITVADGPGQVCR